MGIMPEQIWLEGSQLSNKKCAIMIINAWLTLIHMLSQDKDNKHFKSLGII